MARDASGSHARFAGALRSRVAETGTLGRELRRAILARGAGAGAAAVPEPYEALVRQIAGDSFRVTDAQVNAVLQETGSESDTFEVILTAAVGAGLGRWDAAEKAIRGAGDAAG